MYPPIFVNFNIAKDMKWNPFRVFFVKMNQIMFYMIL